MTKLNRTLGLLLWCALVFAIVALAFGERRVDFWWQLVQETSKAGLHSFGLPHEPYFNEYSLYELSLALLSMAGGLGLVHAAFVATYLLIFALPLTTAGGIRRDLTSLLLVAISTVCIVNRYEERPEIASVLLFTLLLGLLRRVDVFSWRLLAALALLFAIWTNVHSSYLIGLLALGLWLVERCYLAPRDFRWHPAHAALALAVACLALLVNPYGFQRIVFTFAQENDLGSTILSREMWPVWRQPSGAEMLIACAGLVLLVVCIRRPRPAAWLTALAIALYLFTLLHIRHMSFLAATLLALYADREDTAPEPPRTWLRTLGLTAACLLVLLFDIPAARNALGDLTSSEDDRNRGFAPGLLKGQPNSAVLCHDAEGSYIESHYPGQFPLLDSGQMHFDDDTKRFYFFAVQDAHAFDLAVDDLPSVASVVVTPPAGGWTLLLRGRTGWHLAAVTSGGLLFHRGPDSSSDLRPAVMSIAGDAMREADYVHTFCLDTFVDAPRESLGVLARSPVRAWSEAFFSFTRAWSQKVPSEELQAFEKQNPVIANGLLRELLLDRLHAQDPLPPSGPTSLEQLARALTLLDRGNQDAAQKLFATIPKPYVSALYYSLRSRLDPSVIAKEPPFERWQDWNAGGDELFRRLAPKLNQRAANLVGTTASR